MRRTALRSGFTIVLIALAIHLGRPAAVFADPVQITAGFLSIGIPVDFVSSTSFDLTIGDFRLFGSEGDGPQTILDRIMTPNFFLLTPLSFRRAGQFIPARAFSGVQFVAADVSTTPTPFSASGSPTIVEHPIGPAPGTELFSGEVFGSGLATFRFVTAPNGTSRLLRGVNFQFENVAPTPEPANLVLFGTAVMGWGGL